MRRFSISLLLIASSCGNGKAGRPTFVINDTDAGDGATNIASYSPTGCSYVVAPPDTRGYTDFAADDTSTLDAANAVPIRVRIGLGGGTTAGAAGYADPSTTAAFIWETAGSNHASKVKLGADPNTLTDVHAGFSWTTPPVIGNPAYLHEVHVCGLKPATTYYYQVGGGASGSEVWSATQSFTTVPNSGKITVGIFGDARDDVTTWAKVHGRMKDAAVSLQLVSGDIVDLGTVESLYTQWLDAIWKVAPTDDTHFLTLGEQMMVPIAGNHENEAAQFYSNFAIPGDGPYAEQYASFDVGNTHFVMVDDQPLSQDGSDAGNAILTWLDSDLAKANANRTKVPFIVSISHRGLYSTSNHSADGDVLLVRGKLAPLFDKYAVDLVFNGHDHEYERSKPLKAGTPATGAPVVGTGTQYIICAGAGAEPYNIGTAAVDYSLKTTPFGTFSKGTMYAGVYSILTLDGNTLTVNAYGLKPAGVQVADDDLIDTVQVTH